MFNLSAIKNLFKDDKLFVDLTTNGVLNQQQLDVMAELLKNNPEQIKLFQNIYEEYEKTDVLTKSLTVCSFIFTHILVVLAQII